MNLWDMYDDIEEKLKVNLFAIPPYPCVSGKKSKRVAKYIRRKKEF